MSRVGFWPTPHVLAPWHLCSFCTRFNKDLLNFLNSVRPCLDTGDTDGFPPKTLGPKQLKLLIPQRRKPRHHKTRNFRMFYSRLLTGKKKKKKQTKQNLDGETPASKSSLILCPGQKSSYHREPFSDTFLTRRIPADAKTVGKMASLRTLPILYVSPKWGRLMTT